MVIQTLRLGGRGEGLKKIFFSALPASVWSKNKGEGGPMLPGPATAQYRIAFALTRNPYQIGILFTHKKGDFGVISVTE